MLGQSEAKQLSVSEFQLNHLPAGIKERFHLTVDYLPDGQPLIFPALIARGKRPGKTLLITGGVHGDEYEGPIAIQDIFETLDVETMRGTFFGIPILNGPAFTAATRTGSWDHLNLARIFPGRARGSHSERIAYAFQTYLVDQADLLLDMHSGGNLYAIKSLAGYQVRPGELGQTQKAAAIAFGLELVWGTTPLPGRSLSAAGDQGVPAIYVEMRGEGRCQPDQLALAKRGIRHILAFLGIIEGTFPTDPPRYCFETLDEEAGHLQLDHSSPTSGIFVPTVGLWDQVKAGDCLGWVRHPDGTALAEVKSKRAGRILCLRTLPRVFSGDFLVYVLALPEGVE